MTGQLELFAPDPAEPSRPVIGPLAGPRTESGIIRETPHRRTYGGTPSDTGGQYHGAEWLDEHLKFAVPMHMADLHARARAAMARPNPMGLTYEDRVIIMGRNPSGLYIGNRYGTPSTITMLIATQGDSLFGESTPGRAGNLATALAIGLAAAALTQDDGVTFRGKHWCRTSQCPACPEREETSDDRSDQAA